MFKTHILKNPATAIAHRTAEVLNTKLKRNNVLWLLAGGSAKEYYEEIWGLLEEDLDFTKLTISLGDERYEINPNHQTATWPELRKLKIFKELQSQGANIFQILSGGAREVEVERFSSMIEREINGGSFVLASQGIGADGHTAGIIPLEDADIFQEVYLRKGFVVGHSKGGEHPNRITISPETLLVADKIFAYAVGKDKKRALKNMVDLDPKFPEVQWSSELHNTPALYLTVRDAEIFTDQSL